MAALSPGVLLQLSASQWQHSDGPLTIRVENVLHDVSQFYNGCRAWVEGWRLDDAGIAIEWMQALVTTDALPADITPAVADEPSGERE